MSMSEPDLFTLLMSSEVRRDPYPTYARFRHHDAVSDTGFGVWFVFGYQDCLTLLRDRRTSVQPQNVSGFDLPAESPPTLIHLDPPDHDRLRRLVQLAFTPSRVALIRTRAIELVDESLNRFGPGDNIDLVAELAYPMPLTIICEMLGVEPSDRHLIKDWSVWLARSIDPDPLRPPEVNQKIEEAKEAFLEFIKTVIARKRTKPGDDLLSQLVAAELDGDRLNEDELLGLALLLLVAGHETTVSLIGNGMVGLLSRPDQSAHWRAGDVDDRRAIDELLRYDSPVQMTSRIALEPIELSTTTIPRGQVAILMLGSANHDCSVFSSPDTLDLGVERSSVHLSFGSGIHHCLGAALARAEGDAALTQLVRRFPNMELTSEPTLRPTFVLRGREDLQVRL